MKTPLPSAKRSGKHPERGHQRQGEYNMKILTNARVKFMQNMISAQAGTLREMIREVSRLERENVQLSERIAELEAMLFAAGKMDRGTYEAD